MEINHSIIRSVLSDHGENSFKNIAICSCCKRSIPVEIRVKKEIVFPKKNSNIDLFMAYDNFSETPIMLHCTECGEKSTVLIVPCNIADSIKSIMQNNVDISLIHLCKISYSELDIKACKCTKCSIIPPTISFAIHEKSIAKDIIKKLKKYIEDTEADIDFIYVRDEECTAFIISQKLKARVCHEDDIDYSAIADAEGSFTKFINYFASIISTN